MQALGGAGEHAQGTVEQDQRALRGEVGGGGKHGAAAPHIQQRPGRGGAGVKAIEEPASLVELRKRVAAMMPRVDISDTAPIMAAVRGLGGLAAKARARIQPVARPERDVDLHRPGPVVALIGDGAMQMNGVNELITVQRYWRQVLSNDDLSYVSWETRGMLGEPPDPQSQSVPAVPYAKWAMLLGLDGLELRDRDEIGAVWDHALAADRPFVVDAKVDKDIPLVPPHVTLQQALDTAKSQLKGDPDALSIIANGVKETVGAKARPVLGLAPRED